MLQLPLDGPLPRNSGGNGLIFQELIASNIDQKIGCFFLIVIYLCVALELSIPFDDLALPSFEAEGGLGGGWHHDAVVEFDPVRLVGIGGGVDEGIVVSAVVGLSFVDGHSEQDIILIDSCWGLLQEGQVDGIGILKVSQYLSSTAYGLPVLVSLEVEEDDVRKGAEFPHLSHLHLAVLISVDLVIHYFLIKQLGEGRWKVSESIAKVILQKKIDFIEVLGNGTHVWPIRVP